ncbi:Pycsar system effector family protein [Streptomyces chilikensis]|uniref:Pycsar system effector family protein n=1 Tax=Streptomyces chilikensis TaxID=1194079 RepID=UPI000B1F23DF|nr:Pycsar system effector family protein [Streptomyces chilikensis]
MTSAAVVAHRDEGGRAIVSEARGDRAQGDQAREDRPQEDPAQEEQREKAVGTAWRLHATLAEWTRTIDAKASFALAMESAALAGLVTLRGDGRVLGDVSGAVPVALLWAGALLLGLSAVLAVAAVVPRQDRGEAVTARPGDIVYYGHLRHWEPEELVVQLTQQDPLPTLSRQLVRMSRILWKKQRLVRLSLAAAVAGALVTTAAALAG